MIGVVGSTILAIAIVLLVTPGPALLVIPLGLGILAIEFGWARRWLRWAREQAVRNRSGIRARETETSRSAGGAAR